MRRFVIVLSAAALVAIAGCTPTATPASSTTAPTTTAPVQGLREVWVPVNVPIDSAYYPSNAEISVVWVLVDSLERCLTLAVFSSLGPYTPVGEQNCVLEPGGILASPPSPLQPGLTMYGFSYFEVSCFFGCGPFAGRDPAVAVLRIRW
jgi:hypothetical protein